MSHQMVETGFLISNEAWQAIGSMATVVIALLVFVEARAIRKTEWLARLNQSWTEFNRVVVEHADTTRIDEILEGRAVEGELSPRERFLLFQFLDVMSSEYNALRARIMFDDYIYHSFMDSAAALRANRSWIIAFAARRGYEASFVRVLEILADCPADAKVIKRRIRREIFMSGAAGRWLARMTPRRPQADGGSPSEPAPAQSAP